MNSPVVLDIGANIGNHLLPILPLVKKAIAFEPQSNAFDKLKRSIEKNEFTNCLIGNYGLGHEDKNLEFHENLLGNNGRSSFLKQESSNKNEIVLNLPIRNGDAVLDHMEINKLDVIKIDVEDFEFEVFKGIEENIKKYSPVILMEWDAHTTGKDFFNNDVFNNILSGYKVIALEEKDHWWIRNKFWSIRSIVNRNLLGKFKVINFDYSLNYNNILLFKKEHQNIVDATINNTTYE